MDNPDVLQVTCNIWSGPQKGLYADGLTSAGMKTVLDTAKTQSDPFTDSQIIKTKSELTTRLLELETRIKRLESK